MTSGTKADENLKEDEVVMEPDQPVEQGADSEPDSKAADSAEPAAEAADSSDETEASDDPADKLQKEADELRKLLDEKNDRLARTMAEFDNFRKRTEKEKDARYGMGERSVIEKILPVIDNFERGFATVEEEDREDPFVKGMDQVYKQLTGVLADMGVKEIPALGEKFNPDLHNAVMHVDDDSFGESEIVEVFSKGYSYKGTVVRFSMVKVAN